MVNAPETTSGTDRRERPRASAAAHAPALGQANLNPFGDLHTLQHLSARFARALRQQFEPLMRRGLRTWAEPVEVERFADYRAGRAQELTGWVPLQLSPADAQALLVIDGRFALELLDLFFGGSGEAPAQLPAEFTPAAEALIRRIADMLAAPLAAAWEPVAPLAFTPGNVEANAAMLQAVDGEDPVIVTRFGIAPADGAPVFLDLVYPVAALKPHGAQLNTRVHGRTAAADPRWLAGLTRAAMGVRLPVRSVLAEPTVSLARLMELKEGDVIPIGFGPEVPVMVAARCLGRGTVGTANGKAAIRLTALELDQEDFR